MAGVSIYEGIECNCFRRHHAGDCPGDHCWVNVSAGWKLSRRTIQSKKKTDGIQEKVKKVVIQ